MSAVTVSVELPVLREGSLGRPVRAVQARLGVSVTGAFGPGLRQAVAEFQARLGLAMDGVVGPETWRALLEDP